jgi:hypothetical protein
MKSTVASSSYWGAGTGVIYIPKDGAMAVDLVDFKNSLFFDLITQRAWVCVSA